MENFKAKSYLKTEKLIESEQKQKEIPHESSIEVEQKYEDFLPQEFQQDPFNYFEKYGKNIKSGEIKYSENGKISEDPTAVKELPLWTDGTGKNLQVIGKKVNTKKGEIAKSDNPFYEYEVLQLLNDLELPAPKPIAKIKNQDRYIFLMEKVSGIGGHEKDILKLKEFGYTDKDIDDLKDQAENQIEILKSRFEEAGIYRKWAIKDMIFDIDINSKAINKITPTDWERTKIDWQRIEEYKSKNKIRN